MHVQQARVPGKSHLLQVLVVHTTLKLVTAVRVSTFNDHSSSRLLVLPVIRPQDTELALIQRPQFQSPRHRMRVRLQNVQVSNLVQRLPQLVVLSNMPLKLLNLVIRITLTLTLTDMGIAHIQRQHHRQAHHQMHAQLQNALHNQSQSFEG